LRIHTPNRKNQKLCLHTRLDEDLQDDTVFVDILTNSGPMIDSASFNNLLIYYYYNNQMNIPDDGKYCKNVDSSIVPKLVIVYDVSA